MTFVIGNLTFWVGSVAFVVSGLSLRPAIEDYRGPLYVVVSAVAVVGIDGLIEAVDPWASLQIAEAVWSVLASIALWVVTFYLRGLALKFPADAYGPHVVVKLRAAMVQAATETTDRDTAEQLKAAAGVS